MKSKSWSIKRRITILYVISMFGILLVSTVFLYWIIATRLRREDGQFLAAKVGLLREILKEEPDNHDVLQEEIKWEKAPFRLAKYYARIIGPDRKILIETEKMRAVAPVSLFPKPVALSETPSRATEKKSKNGHNLLLMSALARVSGEHPGVEVLQLALDISHEDELIADYRQGLLLVLVVGIFISAGLGMFIADNGLKPIERITKTVKHISAHQLHRRLGQSHWPLELDDLAAAFDEMLDRLQDSFNRLSQFSADLAHELRTPINNLIGETEVALSRQRTSDDYREVMESSLEEYSRLSRILESLLFLARAESPETHIEKMSFDPIREIVDVMEFYEAIAEEGRVSLKHVEDPPEGKKTLNADPTLFRQALSNLISNSLRYTKEGGEVVITTRLLQQGSIEVSVRDDGAGIDGEHLSRVFDRFYRADSSRSENKPGSGLGLAIVKSIMQMHGGTASIASRPGRGTVVTLLFPA